MYFVIILILLDGDLHLTSVNMQQRRVFDDRLHFLGWEFIVSLTIRPVSPGFVPINRSKVPVYHSVSQHS